MDTTEYSLRSLIEKWLASIPESPESPDRLVRFNNRIHTSRGRCACVEALRPAASLAISSLAARTVCHTCSHLWPRVDDECFPAVHRAVGESAGLSNAEPVSSERN